MADGPSKRELLERVETLEQTVNEQNETISKMLPSRRDVVKGSAVLGAGALLGSSSASGAVGSAGQIGTSTDRPDLYGDLVDANLVNTQQLTGGAIESGTWTPQPNGWDTDPSFTTTSYYRVQDLVTITLQFDAGQKSSATSAYLENLPFVNSHPTTTIGVDAGVSELGGALLNGSGEIYFIQNDFSGNSKIYEFTYERSQS